MAAIIELELPEQRILEKLTAWGEYGEANGVIAHALRLADQERAARQAHLEWERAEVQKGWDDLDEGRYTELSTVDLPAYMAERRQRAIELVESGQVKRNRY